MVNNQGLPTKRGKTCGRYQARENVRLAPTWENVWLVSRAGKRPVGTKRGKTCGGYQARQKIRSVASVGHADFIPETAAEFPSPLPTHQKTHCLVTAMCSLIGYLQIQK